MDIGLRIDVDTWRGTRDGVPRLCRMLAERSIRGTFFFSVGPDNMGRHLWRLLRPRFLLKMLRSNAPSLYGWDILLRGTLWPGPIIGRGLASVIRETSANGHEIGVHAWDHQAWQATVHRAGRQRLHEWMRQAVETLTAATGQTPTCAAAPGWRCTDAVLLEHERFPFRFGSDCRGTSIFRPVVKRAGEAHELTQPQIPNTLPTYDEIIGQNGITPDNYNDYLMSLLNRNGLNVLTIHAEVEGIVAADLFEQFLDLIAAQGGSLKPLGELLPDAASSQAASLPRCAVAQKTIPGREGWVGVQVC